jgi:hypothetical protein
VYRYGEGNDLVAFADADYAQDRDTRRSVTGYVLLFAGGPVAWASRLQLTVALSSTESEYMAASDCVRESLYVGRVLDFLYNRKEGKVVIHEDNESCIKLAESDASTKRTKHIDVRYHFLREHVEDGRIVFDYVQSARQLADILTKNVRVETLERLSKLMMGMRDE